MKNFILALGLLIFHFKISAQPTFQHSYGDHRHERCQSAIETHDGGFLLNGATNSYGAGAVDGLMIKTDAQGNIVWSKTCGASYNDVPTYVLETFDHNFVYVGTTDSSGLNDVLLYKTDSTGNFMWCKSYGGSAADNVVKVLELPDHGYAFTGTTESFGAGLADMFFIRTDMNGDTLFTRIYGTADGESAKSVAITNDGGYIICGKSSAMIAGELVIQSILTRVNSAGNILWTKLYGDTLFQEAQSVAETADHGFIVCGSRDFTSNGNYDILLFKTDSMGVLQWSKTYGGDHGEGSYAIHLLADGSYVLSGYTNSMGYGHQLRTGNTNSSGANRPHRDARPLTNFVYGNDSTNIFLMKTNANGDTIWTRSYGDSLQEEAFLSERTSDGGFILSGFSDYHNADSTQMLVLKTDSMGFTGCYERTAHPEIVTDSMMQFSPVYSQNSGMLMSALVLTTTPVSTYDSTYCLLTTAVNEIEEDNSFIIYPNPVSNHLSVKFNSKTIVNINSKKIKVSVYDFLGKKEMSVSVFDGSINEFEINLSSLKQGLYFLEIETDNLKCARRFIKE
jgi:hypothetical protein